MSCEIRCIQFLLLCALSTSKMSSISDNWDIGSVILDLNDIPECEDLEWFDMDMSDFDFVELLEDNYGYSEVKRRKVTPGTKSKKIISTMSSIMAAFVYENAKLKKQFFLEWKNNSLTSDDIDENVLKTEEEVYDNFVSVYGTTPGTQSKPIITELAGLFRKLLTENCKLRYPFNFYIRLQTPGEETYLLNGSLVSVDDHE